ncbi:MAG: glutathione-dependent formaldehyde dehydrogenase [Microbacteriaceae bacterium]|nr:glutathione-dependent formaldehyde dehydrogenase [Microbacteriaceae bacterium]
MGVKTAVAVGAAEVAVGLVSVPEGVSNERALFASDAAPTGWMGADLGGVKPGDVDKFPLGPIMNKGLTLRSAQQHGHRYIPMLLERMARDELTTEHLATHVMPLEDGAEGYARFKEKTDGCVRAVFQP